MFVALGWRATALARCKLRVRGSLRRPESHSSCAFCFLYIDSLAICKTTPASHRHVSSSRSAEKVLSPSSSTVDSGVQIAVDQVHVTHSVAQHPLGLAGLSERTQGPPVHGRDVNDCAALRRIGLDEGDFVRSTADVMSRSVLAGGQSIKGGTRNNFFPGVAPDGARGGGKKREKQRANQAARVFFRGEREKI